LLFTLLARLRSARELALRGGLDGRRAFMRRRRVGVGLALRLLRLLLLGGSEWRVHLLLRRRLLLLLLWRRGLGRVLDVARERELGMVVVGAIVGMIGEEVGHGWRL
jgi:hypothetical protein